MYLITFLVLFNSFLNVHIFNTAFMCFFKFLSNVIYTHIVIIYVTLMQFYSNVWIREHTIDASYSVFCSGISPDQISIAKPGFPKVTYAPLERQTCIVERKAGDKNSSREILLRTCQAYVSAWSVYMRTIENVEYISRRRCTICILLEFGSRWYILPVSCDDGKF